MKSSKDSGVSGKRAAWAIERWVVERIDRDAGVARVESVPMLPDHVTTGLVKGLKAGGLVKGMDRLKFWDVPNIRIRRMSLVRLREILGVRSDEKEALSENMVFWLMHRGDVKKSEHVFHATVAARECAKDLYAEVASKKRRTHESE